MTASCGRSVDTRGRRGVPAQVDPRSGSGSSDSGSALIRGGQRSGIPQLAAGDTIGRGLPGDARHSGTRLVACPPRGPRRTNRQPPMGGRRRARGGSRLRLPSADHRDRGRRHPPARSIPRRPSDFCSDRRSDRARGAGPGARQVIATAGEATQTVDGPPPQCPGRRAFGRAPRHWDRGQTYNSSTPSTPRDGEGGSPARIVNARSAESKTTLDRGGRTRQ